MAYATGTYATYAAVGNREDLIDVVTNISPRDTWFTTNSGNGRASNTLHEWLIDSLKSPTANAQIEGDEITTAVTTAPTRTTNYTQILTATVRISDTNEAVQSAGNVTTAEYQKNKKLIELARDIEYALLINTGAASGASGTARTTKGVLGWITTNVETGTGTGSETLIENMLNANLQAVWAQGGQPSAILCGGFQKRTISGFTSNTRMINADDAKISRAVDVYESDFGALRVVPSTIMNSAAADQLIVFGDMTLWNKAWLAPIKWVELAKTGMSKGWFASAELALEARNQAGSGKITQLATS